MTYPGLLDALPDEAFAIDATAHDWREAIRIAGDRLTAAGFTTPEYSTEMIEAVEKLGPYIVVAPGIAFAHSRPSAAVLGTGMSWVRLSAPVEFGSPKNDPVSLVIGLAATDEKAHLGVMARIAAALGNADKRQRLRTARTPADVREVLDSQGPKK